MPLALVLAGIILIVASVRDKQGELVALVQGDLLGSGSAGQGSFLQWMVALVLVGALGYIPRMKPVSVAFLTLILLAIFLRRGTGFFDRLQDAFNLKAST